MRAPEFWSRDDAVSRTAIACLAPASVIYGASVAWRARNANPYRPKARVVCVGGVTAGGSGKTPVAIAIADAVLARGLKPVFLSRGYGGKLRGPVRVDPDAHRAEEVGDEPLLLARSATTIVARARQEGAVLADALGADVIVMDDGHQNFALEKDLSLVVVDAKAPFGNGHVLPAGPLREPVAQALARADAVVLVGQGPNPDLSGFRGVLLRARIEPDARSALAQTRIVSFAGIGQPEKFFDTLRATGAEVVAVKAFGDHHVYRSAEIKELKAQARDLEARLFTTEKDFVRLSPRDREDIAPFPVRAVFDDPGQAVAVLDRVMQKAIAREPA